MYVGEVIEEMGAEHAQRTVWDFGMWAALWRDWRAQEEDSLEFEVSFALSACAVLTSWPPRIDSFT